MNKLTIVVAIYNVEDYIEKCIETLLNQDYDNYKILLINDGSTDKSEELCLKYQKEYPEKIEVYTKENGGLSSARNYGIEKANSEYIFFVDGDDYIEVNCLSKIMKKVSNNDILVFNYLNIFDDKTILYNTFNETINDSKKRFLEGSPSACNKVFKLELFKKNNIKFPDKLYYEDLATTPLVSQYAKKIVYDVNPYYCYLQRAGSIMHQKKYNKKLEDIFTVFDIIDKELNDEFKKQYEEEIEYLYIWHLLRNASLRFLEFDKYDMLEKINNIIKEKFPKWYKNPYFKKYDIKRKAMCYLIMYKHYKIIKKIRSKGSDK